MVWLFDKKTSRIYKMIVRNAHNYCCFKTLRSIKCPRKRYIAIKMQTYAVLIVLIFLQRSFNKEKEEKYVCTEKNHRGGIF